MGVVILTLLLAVPMLAADVTGKWTFEVTLDMGSGSPSFEFQQDGEKLTGTYSGMAGTAKVTDTVKGDKIAFSFDSDFGKVNYSGTIESADAMKGKADYAGQASGTWTAKRSK